jgi:rhamnosyltransferase
LISFADIVAITVTFHPDMLTLRKQLSALPSECLKIFVDNASPEADKLCLRELIKEVPNTYLLENSSNVGLAAALNQGVKYAGSLNTQPRWCLLLDQDSEPQPNCVSALLEGFNLLVQRGERVGCVGPVLIDVKTGLSHGFHQAYRWMWRRVYPVNGSADPVRCTNLNGSGSLISLDLFNHLGGLDESLFIDHVDTEWSFRVLASGHTLWGIPNVIFQHRMGEDSIRYWLFGWRVWPSRSPARHRYLFRNTLWLMRRDYVPFVWKFWAAVKLAMTASMHGLLDSRRADQVKSMLQGIREGW